MSNTEPLPKELRYEVTINDRDALYVFACSVSVDSGCLVFRDINNKIITAFSKWDMLDIDDIEPAPATQ